MESFDETSNDFELIMDLLDLCNTGVKVVGIPDEKNDFTVTETTSLTRYEERSNMLEVVEVVFETDWSTEVV